MRSRTPITFWLGLLSLWLLVSVACSLTDKISPQVTPTPISTSTLAPTSLPPTPTIVVPPILVESQPLSGSEIGLNPQIVLFFSQPMEHASVEAAVQLDPAISGRFDWIDDTTVRFTPDQPLSTSSPLHISVSDTALSSSGEKLAAPAEISYTTVSPLQITERIPSESVSDASQDSAVVVSFNQPVVALGADPASLTPAFTLEPAAPGRGEWINTSTYIYYPDPALAGGTDYQVKIDPNLKTTNGAGFDGQAAFHLDWQFTTANPTVTLYEPATNSLIPLDSTFTLTFNTPMDAASLRENLILATITGTKAENDVTQAEDQSIDTLVAYDLSMSDDHRIATLKPRQLLERDRTYEVKLYKGALSEGGAIVPHNDYSIYPTVGTLTKISTNLKDNISLQLYDGYGSVLVNFNAPIEFTQDLKALITISPSSEDINISLGYNNSTIQFSGNFQAETEYVITIDKSMQDKWGNPMAEDARVRFLTSAIRPLLMINAFMSGNILFATPDITTVYAQSTNVRNLSIAMQTLDLDGFVTHLNPNAEKTPSGNGVKRWTSLLNITRNKSTQVSVNLTPPGKKLATGLYLYQVTSPDLNTEGSYQNNPFMLVVSTVQMQVKREKTSYFVWVVDLVSDAPVKDGAVNVYDDKGQFIVAGNTAADGTLRLELPDTVDSNKRLFFMMGEPGTPEFSLAVTNWSYGITGSSFGIRNYRESTDPTIYLYTDRPIYRPGQTVNYRAIVRTKNNGRYELPAANQLTMQLYTDYQPATDSRVLLQEQPMGLDSFGTLSGSFALPEDTPPGVYTIEVADPQQSLTFQVAEYRKPEIDLQVNFKQVDYLAGQPLQANVDAKYFFGAPAGSQAVSWRLYANKGYFQMPRNLASGVEEVDWFRYDWFGYGFVSLGRMITEGTGVTAVDGNYQVDIPAVAFEISNFDPSAMQNLTLEVTITDQSNQPVSARSTARMHPEFFYIGAKPETWLGKANQEIGFEVQTVNWFKDPAANQKLKAEFQKVVWNQVIKNDRGFQLYRYVPEVTVIGSTDLATDAQGRARLVFTPPSPGTYRLQVSGGKAITQTSLWVAGEGSPSWPQQPNNHVNLTIDAESYTPGQAANVFIPNPFPGESIALVTVERALVMRHEVITITGSGVSYPVKLGEEDAPNVYVAVTLIGTNADGQPDFRQGYANLNVDPAALQLQVTLTPRPTTTGPGSEVVFEFLVKDSKGKPVSGEFSLALVDKAVLALAEPNSGPIMDYFYSTQPLGVGNSLSLAAFTGRFVPFVGGRGGGGGSEGIIPTTRAKFEDTAFWKGNITTNAEGTAQIKVKMPDNLTTWVAHVTGLSMDALVGETTGEIITTKELLVRPVTPRFLVAGDRVELAAIVHNNTTAELTAEVSLAPVGWAFEDESKASQTVTVAAGGQQRIRWWGRAGDGSAVQLVFSAKAGNLSDSTTPENGDIPILSYLSPQTYSTAGTLDNSGTRTEIIALPRSFQANSANLTVELSPSLAGTMMGALETFASKADDISEPGVSELLAYTMTYSALINGAPASELLTNLRTVVVKAIDQISRSQNSDGGWGWAPGSYSNPNTSTYTLYALGRARDAGFEVPEPTISRAIEYLKASLPDPIALKYSWQLNDLAFQYYTLNMAGVEDLDYAGLYEFRDRLDPWAKAMLARTLQNSKYDQEKGLTLMSDLTATAIRTSTGAHWEDASPSYWRPTSANFNTAVVISVLSNFDPTYPLIPEAIRYLAAHRHVNGGWSSSYETAWVVKALAQVMISGGELTSTYQFNAALNHTSLLEGVAGASNYTPVSSSLPLTNLAPGSGNLLQIQRDGTGGTLYYRASLQVNRPAETAPAVERGLTLTRAYYHAGQDCRKIACQPASSISIQENGMLYVRLTLTLPTDMYDVVVEDHIPAGAEIVNTNLLTTQLGQGDESAAPQFAADDPFSNGWGWWSFTQPVIFDDHIRWVAETASAGTYTLTYRLQPLYAGEFRLIPAQAYMYYFPEVQGASSGGIFTIQP